VTPGQQKAGQAARCLPAGLAAPALDPHPPGSRQVLGLAPVAAMPHHPAHCLAMTALPWPRTELVPLIFAVFLDFWRKGDYNDHNVFEGRLLVSCPGFLSAAPSPYFQDRGKAYLFCPRWQRKRPLSLERPVGQGHGLHSFILAETVRFQLFISAGNTLILTKQCEKKHIIDMIFKHIYTVLYAHIV
jgi:hypothetical protein